MSDLKELYQEVILDHQKHPRNFGSLSDATHRQEGYNPLCGDRIILYLKLQNNRIEDIAFQGSGCAISTASASVMTEAVKGKTVEEAEALYHAFHELVTGRPSETNTGTKRPPLGKLAVFSGVREFPVRVKCATLAWHTLRAALEGRQETVSTE
ncbi:MAG: SUF system NifU family Fe-S cluster assembly protein [Gemmatales bacterium]|nr:SUF system NifU family Fe-S cluster assembly protein [Gemmatales bacterium]